MPVTPSARKALRNSRAKQERNTLVKAELKRVLKNATAENLSKVVSLVDKAAKRHIIHVNKAARIKSHLSKIASGAVTSTKKVVKRTSAKKTAAVKAKAIKARTTKTTAKK